MTRQLTPNIKITVQHGDALRIAADVLVLKYANALFGADRAVVHAIEDAGQEIRDRLPKPSGFYITSVRGILAANQVIFIGVGPLRQFEYKQIRAFSRRALSALAGESPEAKHVVLTAHGPGYGLDEAEAFMSEIAGLIEAINSEDFPIALKKITIAEANPGRAKRFIRFLDQFLTEKDMFAGSHLDDYAMHAQPRGVPQSAGYNSERKPRIFVAMPFAEEMEDVFHYGIQGAANAAGFLCERADLSSFTGDIIQWVKNRIAKASLVIADLSDANPNVYLEVGYAWGCGRPTVLLVKDIGHLKFDVQGQRCLVYKTIKELETALRKELGNLKELPF